MKTLLILLLSVPGLTVAAAVFACSGDDRVDASAAQQQMCVNLTDRDASNTPQCEP